MSYMIFILGGLGNVTQMVLQYSIDPPFPGADVALGAKMLHCGAMGPGRHKTDPDKIHTTHNNTNARKSSTVLRLFLYASPVRQ